MSRLRVFTAAAVSLLVGTGAQAAIILHANLNDASENPPTVPTLTTGAPRPASLGTADFVLNDARTAMSFTATIFNVDFTGSQTSDVNDNLIAAHIHASPTAGLTAPNAPVVWGFFGSPFNDTNSPTAALLSDCTPFSTGVGGTCAGTWDLNEGNGVVSPGVPVTLTNQLSNILSGHSYINFHTTQFPGGELRGFLAVSEPSSLALLGVAAFGLFAFVSRRGVSPRS
jgi:CHRD domain-containing protein/PEP-CTERM motif-containing protein